MCNVVFAEVSLCISLITVIIIVLLVFVMGWGVGLCLCAVFWHRPDITALLDWAQNTNPHLLSSGSPERWARFLLVIF